MSRKLEITRNAKTCSKQKKVAQNTESCQKIVEQLVASPIIGHSGAEK